MVKVELFRMADHYALVSDWWKRQEWMLVPQDHLPDIGLISFIEDMPAAAGWIYQTDSAFCLFEFLVANPDIRKEQRSTAIEALVDKAKEASREMGFKTIFMSVTNDSLIRRLEKQGFKANEKGMTNLTYSIGG